MHDFLIFFVYNWRSKSMKVIYFDLLVTVLRVRSSNFLSAVVVLSKER
jgi:hypothetical protein